MTHPGAFWHQHLLMSPLVCLSPLEVSLADEFDPAGRCFSPFMTLSQETWKSSLLCGTTLEVFCSYNVLLPPNHGHNSILILSLALIQSISN